MLSFCNVLPDSRSIFTGMMLLGAAFVVGCVFLPVAAVAQTSAAQAPSSSSSSTATIEQSSRRELTTRRMETKRRREAQIVTDTYTHRWEVYLGGQYMRFRPGPNLHNSGMGGWVFGATRYFNPRWGIATDARGNFGDNSLGATSSGGFNTYNAKFDIFTFMIGPQYRFYGSPKFSVSGAVQVGDVYGYFDKNTGPFAPQLLGFYPASHVGGAIASLNLDYNLSPGLAVRVTPNVLLDHFGGNIDHNQGFMIGMVYRLGRQ